MYLLPTSYIRNSIDASCRKYVIDATISRLENVVNQFDMVVCTGTSGLTVAPIVAYLLNKQLAVCRKTIESSHASCIFETVWDSDLHNGNPPRFILLDDFLSSGYTYRRMLYNVWSAIPNAKLVGSAQYMIFGRNIEDMPKLESTVWNGFWYTPQKIYDKIRHVTTRYSSATNATRLETAAECDLVISMFQDNFKLNDSTPQLRWEGNYD